MGSRLLVATLLVPTLLVPTLLVPTLGGTMHLTMRAAEARRQIWGLTVGGLVACVVGALVALDAASIDSEFDSVDNVELNVGFAVLGAGGLVMLVGLVGLGTMLGLRAMDGQITAAAPTDRPKPTAGGAGQGSGRGKSRRPDPGPMPDWAVKDPDR